MVSLLKFWIAGLAVGLCCLVVCLYALLIRDDLVLPLGVEKAAFDEGAGDFVEKDSHFADLQVLHQSLGKVFDLLVVVSLVATLGMLILAGVGVWRERRVSSEGAR